jgi:hypothetical protein
VVGHPAHNIQQLVLARSFIISNCGFNEMPGTVQLMAVLEIGPAFARFLNCEVSIQVSVFLLRFSDQINHFICLTLQLRIAVDAERITCRLQPLGHITILEDHAPELACSPARSDFEVGDGMARFRLRHPVMQCFILIRNNRVLHQPDITSPEFILNGCRQTCISGLLNICKFAHCVISPFSFHSRYLQL